MAQKQPQPVPIPTKNNPVKRRNTGQKTVLKLISHQRIAKQKALSETPVLLALSLFLLTNIGFLLLIDISPERLLRALGAAPDLFYLDLVYALFLFSEILLIISRLEDKPVACYAWRQLAFSLAFYAFFWLTGALAENLVLLLASGLGLLLSEYFRLLRLKIKGIDTSAEVEAEY
jgi:hypothetical protein